MSAASSRPEDFPPGLSGGVDADKDDHRVGETSQTGPDAGKINRGHPEWARQSREGEDVAERAAGDGGERSSGIVKP